jgi:hypothetical protein
MARRHGMTSSAIVVGESCWSQGHLLAHCENYRVESHDGLIGYVAAVDVAEGGTEGALIVAGRGDPPFFRIPVEDVLELHPDGERILVSRPRAVPGQLRPLRAARIGSRRPSRLEPELRVP